MRRRRTTGAVLVLGLLAVLTATAGCEESVDPVIGTDLPFTIWGFMNAGADTQLVRVFPITRAFAPAGQDGIDAAVFSTDLTTGERRAWTYRQVTFDSLGTGHLFWSPFRAEHGHRYRLEVVRSDGATSSAEVVVPSQAQVEVDAAEGLRVSVEIEGAVPNLIGPRVTYHATNLPPNSVWPPGAPFHPIVYHPVTVSYEGQAFPRAGGWMLNLDLLKDFGAVQVAYRANCLVTPEGGSAPDIWLRFVEFSAVVADSSWAPPGGVFDPEVLSVPGTFSNVENGYGFFGAGQGIRYRWTPSIETRLQAGYDFNPQCPGTASDIPQCKNPPVPCLGENAHDLWELWLR